MLCFSLSLMPEPLVSALFLAWRWLWFLSPMSLVSAWKKLSCRPLCLLLFYRVALTLVLLLLLLVLLPVSLAALFLPPHTCGGHYCAVVVGLRQPGIG